MADIPSPCYDSSGCACVKVAIISCSVVRIRQAVGLVVRIWIDMRGQHPRAFLKYHPDKIKYLVNKSALALISLGQSQLHQRPTTRIVKILISRSVTRPSVAQKLRCRKHGKCLIQKLFRLGYRRRSMLGIKAKPLCGVRKHLKILIKNYTFFNIVILFCKNFSAHKAPPICRTRSLCFFQTNCQTFPWHPSPRI